MKTPIIVWLIALGFLFAYELFALATGGVLLSPVVWKYSRDYPLIPFASGFLMGHFFFPKSGPSAPETAT